MTAVDALDAARAAATAGPWENPHPFTKLINAPGSTDNLAIVRCYNEADAALIVAAVNALPELLAEVRRGRALREAVEGLAGTWATLQPEDRNVHRYSAALADAAHLLRTALDPS